jgi:hypothetical protein
MEDMELLKEVDMRKTGYLSLIVLFSILVAAPAIAGGPWQGKLIDMQTQQPLEGAVVLAVWERVYRTPAGPNSYFYEAKEVLTDREGKFKIPLYRPINLLPLISYLRGPYFTLFKPGYLSLSGVDIGPFFLEGTRNAPVERSEIGGGRYRLAPGTIELPKLQTREERLNAQSNARPLADVPDEKIPFLSNLINTERINLGLAPIHIGR